MRSAENRHWRSRLIECCQGDGVLLGSVSAIRAFSLQRWIRLPAARARCVCHFLGIAATLAAAKVLLSTIGVAQFVSEQGAAGLPPFYVGFAAIAILLSFGLGSIIDRVPKVRLAQLTFAALLGGTAALCIPLALGVPGIGFALLASATAFEIILDIVFWVVVAAYLDAFEFRRGTPLIYMALALGGAAGGTIARVGAGTLSPPDFLLLLLPLAVLLMVQLDVVARRLREVPDNHSDLDGAEEGSGPLLLGRLLKRYPLALLIALNALVVTLLYGLSEFLVLSIYEKRFASDVELTEFLSLLFAFMQIIEFGLLYTLTRVLLERAGPLLRNLAFPMTSLGSLLLLTISPRLPAAVAMHVNIEAVSNAIFLPIGNANYIPLPLSCQGRARTLSEGIFYPIGLALAGLVLWAVDSDAALRQVEYVSLVFAGLFVLLGVGIGVLFLPTLRANVGAGLITPGQAVGSELLSAPRIRTLLHSREVELCLLGVALARRHGPATLEDDLLALATRPDRVTRTALARLVADAPRPWGQSFLGRTLARGGTEEVKLALLVLLIRRAPLQPEHQPRILGAHDPTVLVLGYVVAQGLRAWDQIQPLIGDAEIASDLVDAIVSAERADLALLLFACLASAAPEQQCRALVMLNSAAGPVSGATTDILRRLASRPDPFVRAEAIVLLSRTLAPARAVAELLAALDDPSRHVRHRIAEALCAYGDQTTAALRGRLRTVCASTPDAVRALAQIATPEARRLLASFVRALQQDAERTAGLLASIAARHDRARWSTLELCLCEHQARIVDVAMAALSSAIESRLARRIRDALHSDDQRSRACAFELIAATPGSRLAPGAVALLRYVLFESGDERPLDSGADTVGRILVEARASMSPWLRRAVALLATPPSLRSRSQPSTRTTGSGPKGEQAMALDDDEFERIVALKRTPLFRYVPFETMVEVSRSVQPRTYLAGEQVVGSRGWQDLLILEAGVLSLEHPGRPQTLAAPACFGEVALVGERVPWPRMTALEDSRVWFLRATVFQELCHEHPDMAIELCRLLARRVREADNALPAD